ncbi:MULTISPECIES: hypothetical protein [Halomonas]|jgi:hypothetical protein|uniref:Uncharacterized protein n=3 Tax=Halomonas TaxID=2745 RepID=A0AAU7KI33_9GAMM|nr:MULTISPECIES: hypothetical protein [Halomonas]MBR9879300.1 hypothetical protein [Gammaproteobacteria bacterium]KJZ17261.1 hypothetical protein TW86_04330 [Halomonas sp. S2151]MAR74726.1 hypothetical protein [Halomonas sp.]MAY70559.1 hypothetical protein [Halomonas sp.]MBS8269740.1 hypothetical protein [Halomonas litopenaei]|tara:strand:+ start:235 stop:540 length:306 start_codon:yes stop_codon:yes gene_type:complete
MPKDLCGDWIEMREEGIGDCTVLRHPDSPAVTPSRMPRRRLCLHQDGAVELHTGDAADRLACDARGQWRRDGDQLHLTLPGWDGDYDIDALEDDLLIITRH